MTSTPHQPAPQRTTSSVRLRFSATQRPSIGANSPGCDWATASTQKTAIIAASHGAVRMFDLTYVRRPLPRVAAIVVVLTFVLLVLPTAAIALALGSGLLPLPYEL